MAFNLQNRDLLSLVHHSERDLIYLIDLAPGSQARQVLRCRQALAGRQEHCADLREDLDPHPVCIRGWPPTTRAHVTHIDPTSSQIGHRSR